MTSHPRPTAKQHDAFSDQKLLFLMHCLLPISGLTMTFLLPAGVANCSTVEAKTPELADVKAAILSAHENDTVKVPPGTASWTSTLIITKGITTIQENRDFYNQKTPFDSTAGAGVGKLSNRPKTCTPGVAYWATDEGEWDSTHDGPDGQLYVCTARETWTLYYKPYSYPHPLVTGNPASSAKAIQDQQKADRQSSSKK